MLLNADTASIQHQHSRPAQAYTAFQLLYSQADLETGTSTSFQLETATTLFMLIAIIQH